MNVVSIQFDLMLMKSEVKKYLRMSATRIPESCHCHCFLSMCSHVGLYQRMRERGTILLFSKEVKPTGVTVALGTNPSTRMILHCRTHVELV